MAKTVSDVTLIHQDSGKTSWHTPPEIVDAAREVMGGIDLDPASSSTANKTVRASIYYTARDDGLSKPWVGRVWMNHPFSRDGNPKWIGRLVSAYETGEIEQAICITYAAINAAWFQRLLRYPRWIPSSRVDYIDPFAEPGDERTGAPKDSIVTYLGPDTDRFAQIFMARLGGSVDVPYFRRDETMSGNIGEHQSYAVYRNGERYTLVWSGLPLDYVRDVLGVYDYDAL